jgi:hypothetical protein
LTADPKTSHTHTLTEIIQKVQTPKKLKALTTATISSRGRRREMEEQQQQRQKQQIIHSAVVSGIARVKDARYRKERHTTAVRMSMDTTTHPWIDKACSISLTFSITSTLINSL